MMRLIEKTMSSGWLRKEGTLMRSFNSSASRPATTSSASLTAFRNRARNHTDIVAVGFFPAKAMPFWDFFCCNGQYHRHTKCRLMPFATAPSAYRQCVRHVRLPPKAYRFCADGGRLISNGDLPHSANNSRRLCFGGRFDAAVHFLNNRAVAQFVQSHAGGRLNFAMFRCPFCRQEFFAGKLKRFFFRKSSAPILVASTAVSMLARLIITTGMLSLAVFRPLFQQVMPSQSGIKYPAIPWPDAFGNAIGALLRHSRPNNGIAFVLQLISESRSRMPTSSSTIKISLLRISFRHFGKAILTHRAAAVLIAQADTAAMLLDIFFHNGQTQPVPVGLSVTYGSKALCSISLLKLYRCCRRSGTCPPSCAPFRRTWRLPTLPLLRICQVYATLGARRRIGNNRQISVLSRALNLHAPASYNTNTSNTKPFKSCFSLIQRRRTRIIAERFDHFFQRGNLFDDGIG